ncbi:colicin E3/pyocin S6 family cytotoxin [Paenibacillus glucanolyticus]|uniref:colicin E3/pyocin S6 family cytotoxin n=1 Tax=Paenibacillus glucanolyticus TaxID=59843 RepID=UPI0034CEA5A6
MHVNWADIPASQYPFLEDKKPTRLKCKDQKIYTDKKKRFYYHKDSLHGEIEMYNSRGEHLGVLTPEGNPHPKKGKVNGRKINV